MNDDLELTLDDILAHRQIAHELTQGRPHVVLAIAGERMQATEEARRYAANTVPEGRVAEAIIIGSLPVRIMGNFYLKFHKPEVPTRMFDKREEALKWLRAQLSASVARAAEN